MIRGTGIDSTVKLYLKGNGANESTKFFDDSQSHKTVTAYGNAQISTTENKFGGSSLKFDGTGDYLTVTNFLAGLNKYHIGVWLKLNATLTCYRVFGNATGNYWGMYFLDIGALRYYVGGIYLNWTISGVTVTDWNYYTITSDGTNIKLYINGDSKQSVASASTISSETNIAFGRWEDYTFESYLGYMDELQIIIGDSVASIDLTKVPTRQRG